MVQAAIPAGSLRLSGYYPGITLSNQITPFPLVPLGLSDHRQWLYQMANVVNGLMSGKSNNTGILTLTASATTTTISLSDGRIGPNTFVLLCPLTASAATEFGAGTLYVSARDPANNQFTVSHVNSGVTDRRFGYLLVG